MIDIEKVRIDLIMSDSMKVAGCHVLSQETYKDVHNALIELRGLQKFKATFDAYELSKKQDFIAYENWVEAEKELNELILDVKRYFELDRLSGLWISEREQVELTKLVEKLSKVGDEK